MPVGQKRESDLLWEDEFKVPATQREYPMSTDLRASKPIQDLRIYKDFLCLAEGGEENSHIS